MTLRSGFIVPALALGLLVAGCSKKQTEVSSSAPAAPAAPAASATPAAPAAASPAAPAAAAAPPAGPAEISVADTTARLAAADWALKQDEIKRDPDGQWASEA